jgi:RNA polymerase sigma factor (sigma-70 family)
MLKLQSRRTMERLEAAGSPAGYVIVMMRNAFTDLARRRLREVQAEEPLEEMIASDLSHQPEAQNDEQIERLKRALASLRPEERYMLRMRYWKNLSIGEISGVIGISYSAAAVRLFRIVSLLREAMSQ